MAKGTKADTDVAEAKPKRAPAKTKADGAAPKAAAKPARAKPAGGVDGAHKGVTASPELAAIIGDDTMKRTEVVSKVWDYVRKHNLQNPADKREIIADAKLKKVFGQDKATMFEMNRLVFAHLK